MLSGPEAPRPSRCRQDDSQKRGQHHRRCRVSGVTLPQKVLSDHRCSSDVDISFFLVTVDLWSADGKQEMNLVLHPSTSERPTPPNLLGSKALRRRNTSASHKSGNITPVPSTTPTPSQVEVPLAGRPYINKLTVTQPSESANPYPSNTSPSTQPQTWGYPPQPPVDRTTTYGPPILPSISNLARSSASAAEPWSTGGSQESGSYGMSSF